VTIRALRPDDVAFLETMFVYTICWREGAPTRPLEVLLDDPALARYVVGWPRAGDEGVVAVDVSGARLGAAWYRLFEEGDHGFGFVSADVPELGIAVLPERRGRGVGARLMKALIARARLSGHPALSLSVEEDNMRAYRLYEACGFERVGRVGGAWTMLRRTDPVRLDATGPVRTTNSRLSDT
jgi:ribosomal protein S18 acetylase RimI-like enzyme